MMGEEKELLMGIAESLLRETNYVTECEPHETLTSNDDPDALDAAYKLANARITSGTITLPSGFTRRDLTDAIKEVAEGTGDECYSCRRNEEA